LRRIASISWLIPAFLSAQTVQIEGVAPGFIGGKAQLIQTVDLISGSEKVVCESTVGTDSLFHLTCDLNETSAFQLCVDNTCGPLYLQPDGKYTILFPEPEIRSAYNLRRNKVELIFENLPKTDINYRILQFDRWLDEFLAQELFTLANDSFRLALDTFKYDVATYYQDYKDPYFFDHVVYSIASVERIGHIADDREKNKARVYIDYLLNKPVKTGHQQYMRFFDSFYENYLSMANRTFENALNAHLAKGNINGIRNLLRQDIYLGDSLLLELVMVKGLLDLHRVGDFPSDRIEHALLQISKSSKFEQAANIAGLVYNKLIALVPGNQAPELNLPTVTSDTVRLADLKGKYVYLTFFDPECTPCLSDFHIMPSLHERYGKDFEFISISTRSNMESLRKFAAAHREVYWTLADLDNQQHVLQQYKVSTLPWYILIDREGRIIQAPSYAPSPNGTYVSIDKTFFDLKKSEGQ
jgi:peroxiredoxin